MTGSGSDGVFPTSALPANRAGLLDARQVAALGLQARESRRTGLQAGLAIVGFGALLLFGAMSGRIGDGRIGSLALGAVFVLFGGWLALSRTPTRGTAAAARAGGGGELRVDAVAGDIRKSRGNGDTWLDAMLDAGDASSDRNERYRLHVGGRCFDVTRAQYDATPAQGRVVAYVLPGSDSLVNLEHVGPSQRDRQRQQALRDRGIVPTDEPPAPSALDGAELRQALVGRWSNEAIGIAFEFRADGRALSVHRGRHDEEAVWSVAGPGHIRVGDATLAVSLPDDRLILHGPGSAGLQLHRVR